MLLSSSSASAQFDARMSKHATETPSHWPSMKRDLELCRKIFILLESRPPGEYGLDPDQLEVDWATLACHIELLHGAKLLEANFSYCDGNVPPASFQIERLTWEGHEFLNASRDDSTWLAAKEKLGDKAGSVTFSVLMSVLAAITLSQLGLK